MFPPQCVSERGSKSGSSYLKLKTSVASHLLIKKTSVLAKKEKKNMFLLRAGLWF